MYVDDDAEDREFLSLMLSDAGPDVKVQLVENGLKALDYLNSVKDSGLPSLIVLDLNMPFLNGHETFQRIRTDEALHDVPVIIFSSSERPIDKRSFNELGIEFFTKPDCVDQFEKIARHMVSVYCRC